MGTIDFTKVDMRLTDNEMSAIQTVSNLVDKYTPVDEQAERHLQIGLLMVDIEEYREVEEETEN